MSVASCLWLAGLFSVPVLVHVSVRDPFLTNCAAAAAFDHPGQHRHDAHKQPLARALPFRVRGRVPLRCERVRSLGERGVGHAFSWLSVAGAAAEGLGERFRAQAALVPGGVQCVLPAASPRASAVPGALAAA